MNVCGDSDKAFSVYDESQTALVGILAVCCVVCGRAERRCPTQFHSTVLYVQLRQHLLTRRRPSGGAESSQYTLSQYTLESSGERERGEWRERREREDLSVR